MSAQAGEQCSGWHLMLHGFIDGELDAAHSLEFEQHLVACEHCAAELERFRVLRLIVGQKGVRWQAPAHVRSQVLVAITRENAAHTAPTAALAREKAKHFKLSAFIRRWSFVPSAAALAACLFLLSAAPKNTSSVQDEIFEESCTFAACRSPDRCHFIRRAHRQAMVQRKDRFLASGRRSRRPRISPGRRPRRLHRWARRGSADLPPAWALHKRVRLARPICRNDNHDAGGLHADKLDREWAKLLGSLRYCGSRQIPR